MSETSLKDKISNMIRQWEGPLTRELLLQPGSFGLGKVPERKPIETEDLIYEMLKGRIKKSKVKGTPRYSVRRN